MSPISAAHRRFTSAEDWHSAIAPHFAGSRYTRRAQSFSLWGRLERLGDTLLLDNCVAASGLGPTNDTYGLSIDPLETSSCFILLQRDGRAFVKQADQATELRAGEWAIFDASLPTSFLIPDASRTIGLAVPHRYGERWSRIQIGGMRLARSPESRVALAMIVEALGFVEWPSSRVQASMEILLMDAVEASLAADANERSALMLVAAKIEQVRQAIEVQLSNPNLSPDDIGRSVGLSRRSLYRLFRQINQTPMGLVQEARLARAARLLQHRPEGASITSVSYSVGFVDPTHFSRLFRARYGQSPRQWTLTASRNAAAR
ncbi:helix-turn-helix domain-containing protein [Rhodopseudomonas palustris]|uniref:helix-turn-helix domain-containing protein n=1 Tax=Rhodopseudomonas palustris TaxID=1076 RepID=UPI002ACD8B7D|nr:helix-turn-helix domain-containing protein [Rhodopseudomonas palustris]WQH00506.1 helix-turn-helix domain-containing protein [Rhodopseudomonas palustris]